jgi:hypothetical protein
MCQGGAGYLRPTLGKKRGPSLGKERAPAAFKLHKMSALSKSASGNIRLPNRVIRYRDSLLASCKWLVRVGGPVAFLAPRLVDLTMEMYGLSLEVR